MAKGGDKWREKGIRGRRDKMKGGRCSGVSDPGGVAVAVTTCGHVGIARVLRLPDWQNAMKYTCPIPFIVSCTIDTMAP